MEILKAMAFWHTAPCSLVEVGQYAPLKRRPASIRLHGAIPEGYHLQTLRGENHISLIWRSSLSYAVLCNFIPLQYKEQPTSYMPLASRFHETESGNKKKHPE
jgi:hypothetical protein